MNPALVRALAEKDLRVVMRSRMVMLPMLLVPMLLLALLPAAIIVVPQMVPGAASSEEFRDVLAKLPPQMQARMAGYEPLQQMVIYVAGYMWAPLFLIVPLMVAGGVAADSFAGERERKTLEALLHTPLTDLELFAGKVAAAWAMAMLVAVLGFVVYGLTVNVAAWPVMGRVFFPNVTWLLLIGWVTPAVALLGLGAVVIISARVSTAHEAFQVGGLVVLPVVVLLLGQISGALFLGPALMLGLGAALWLLALGVLRIGFGTFRRTSLISRV